MNKVSILLCAYNAEAYIAEAIESTLAQTYRDFKLWTDIDCRGGRFRALYTGIRTTSWCCTTSAAAGGRASGCSAWPTRPHC